MSLFTPSSTVNADSNPRDWAYEIGCLPETASIVFTKASLLAFLKTHGIEVGPNSAEISKLPRYASVGKMTKAEAPRPSPAEAYVPAIAPSPVESRKALEPAARAEALEAIPVEAETKKEEAHARASTAQRAAAAAAPAATTNMTTTVKTPDGEAFRPTRRVREPIGGGSAQIGALFGGGDDDHEEAVREAERENAKRRGLTLPSSDDVKPTEHKVHTPLSSSSIENQATRGQAEEEVKTSSSFRPTRRVREPGGTGGQSSITLG